VSFRKRKEGKTMCFGKAKFFFVGRDFKSHDLFILQSDEDERKFFPSLVGPFFSSREAANFIMTWL
jgi:hypothetical protein